MLDEFQLMWDGHLGTMKAAKQRIELTPPNAGPFQSIPYSAGTAAYALEKTEIDRPLTKDVI